MDIHKKLASPIYFLKSEIFKNTILFLVYIIKKTTVHNFSFQDPKIWAGR